MVLEGVGVGACGINMEPAELLKGQLMFKCGINNVDTVNNK